LLEQQFMLVRQCACALPAICEARAVATQPRVARSKQIKEYLSLLRNVVQASENVTAFQVSAFSNDLWSAKLRLLLFRALLISFV
jgi:hypothetical protein